MNNIINENVKKINEIMKEAKENIVSYSERRLTDEYRKKGELLSTSLLFNIKLILKELFKETDLKNNDGMILYLTVILEECIREAIFKHGKELYVWENKLHLRGEGQYALYLRGEGEYESFIEIKKHSDWLEFNLNWDKKSYGRYIVKNNEIKGSVSKYEDGKLEYAHTCKYNYADDGLINGINIKIEDYALPDIPCYVKFVDMYRNYTYEDDGIYTKEEVVLKSQEDREDCYHQRVPIFEDKNEYRYLLRRIYPCDGITWEHFRVNENEEELLEKTFPELWSLAEEKVPKGTMHI